MVNIMNIEQLSDQVYALLKRVEALEKKHLDTPIPRSRPIPILGKSTHLLHIPDEAPSPLIRERRLKPKE